MRKFLPILMILFFALPITNALAHDDGYLGANTQYAQFGSIVDNDLNTSYGFLTELWLTKDLPSLNINSVFLSLDNNYGAFVNFYDSRGYLISSESVNSSEGFKKITEVKGVHRIKVTVPNGQNRRVQEFDFKVAEELVIDNKPVTNLTENHTHDSIDLTWVNPDTSHIESIIIKSNGIEVESLSNTSETYSLINLSPETLYNIEVIVKYSDGTISAAKNINVITKELPKDTQPPKNILSLSVDKTSESINFNYLLPDDEDFSHLMIYRDNVLIEAKYLTSKFIDKNLKPNTTYSYKFVSVDFTGNSSSGYIQTVTTDIEEDNNPPIAPTGLILTFGNQSGKLTWNKNREADLKGYNVYVNGVKHNAALLLTNNYIVTGLENDSSYSITVTAVDTSGNESVMSIAQTLIPSKDSMPIFKTDYDLKAVADGTGNWFLALWPILAFAVGIPLAFYVSNRVKSLFFA